MHISVLRSLLVVIVACTSTSTNAPPTAPADGGTPSAPATPTSAVSGPLGTVGPASPVPMTPRPTEASFDLRTEVGRAPGEFSAVVSGLDPNEAFTFVVGMPGRPGTPMRESADERGRFEIHFDQPAPGGTCLLAKRSGGQIARSEVGVPAGGACAADVVYLYLSGPATLRASEFTDFTSVAPAGEVVEFIGLVGPDGPLVPDWTSERLGPPPEGILFQLSPSYDRQGPLPPGPYIISYRLMGQEYHFTLTITR